MLASNYMMKPPKTNSTMIDTSTFKFEPYVDLAEETTETFAVYTLDALVAYARYYYNAYFREKKSFNDIRKYISKGYEQVILELKEKHKTEIIREKKKRNSLLDNSYIISADHIVDGCKILIPKTAKHEISADIKI